MHKTAQGMSLEEARDSLKIINGNMKKLKHNGCCIATSIHNLMDAWRAIAAAVPAVPAAADVHAVPAVPAVADVPAVPAEPAVPAVPAAAAELAVPAEPAADDGP
jgi:hypothetical protein